MYFIDDIADGAADKLRRHKEKSIVPETGVMLFICMQGLPGAVQKNVKQVKL